MHETPQIVDEINDSIEKEVKFLEKANSFREEGGQAEKSNAYPLILRKNRRMKMSMSKPILEDPKRIRYVKEWLTEFNAAYTAGLRRLTLEYIVALETKVKQLEALLEIENGLD